jgi:flagellar basal-body rod protein FlgF
MDPISISAASGMRSRMESLDLIANNIANTSTTGFKADREFYNLYVGPDALDGNSAADTLPVLQRHWTDFGQGNLAPTGNPFDLGLSGKGFFTVSGPNGPLYTRSGNFQISLSGDLQTQDGKAVQGQDGKPIKLDPKKAAKVKRDGTIEQDGLVAGKLALVDVSTPESLEKMGSTFFKLTNVKELVKSANATVQQGVLETGNGSPAEQAVRLVGVMRQFEMLQRAMSIGNEMSKKAVDEVARVNA